tara:strand:- start:254 stop:460 length:207 start_codon:yes stop_codon:yes gene_type:complete
MFSRDLVERVVATFVQASLGAMTSNSMFDLGVDQWKMMAGAGVAAAISVLKGSLASKLGTKGTASLTD